MDSGNNLYFKAAPSPSPRWDTGFIVQAEVVGTNHRTRSHINPRHVCFGNIVPKHNKTT